MECISEYFRQAEEYYDEDFENPIFRNVTADMKHSTPTKMIPGQNDVHNPAPSVVADLLSELNLSEVRVFQPSLFRQY